MSYWQVTQQGLNATTNGSALQAYFQSETHGFLDARITPDGNDRVHAIVVFDKPADVRKAADVRDLFKRDPQRAAAVMPAQLKEGVNYISRLNNIDHHAFKSRVPQNISIAIDNGRSVEEAIKLGTLAEFGITGDVAKLFVDELNYSDLADHLVASMPKGPPQVSGDFGSDYETKQPDSTVNVRMTHWNGAAVQSPVIDSTKATNILAKATGINVGDAPVNKGPLACAIEQSQPGGMP